MLIAIRNPIFYSNNVGAQTELIFDGGSVVMSPNGKIFREMPYFKETLEVFDLHEVKGGFINQMSRKKIIFRKSMMHLIFGVKDYFGKLGFTKAILGLSGGIDSAVTAVIAARALGSENVQGAY